MVLVCFCVILGVVDTPKTPAEIKFYNQRPIELMVRHAACLCAAGDIPCLKHHRAAFDVWFVAKYGCDPFGSYGYKVDGITARSWHPFEFRRECPYRFALSAHTISRVFYHIPEKLPERLRLPIRIVAAYGAWGWCAYRRGTYSRPTTRGDDLEQAIVRYTLRGF